MIPIPRCRLLVAPSEGRVTGALPERTPVAVGDVVATIATRGGVRELRAPRAGLVGGALTDVEQPVAPGDVVVWLDVATTTASPEEAAVRPVRAVGPAAPTVTEQHDVDLAGAA